MARALNGFFWRAAGRSVDIDLAADGVTYAVRSALVGIGCTGDGQAARRRQVRLLMLAYFGVASLQLVDQGQRFGCQCGGCRR